MNPITVFMALGIITTIVFFLMLINGELSHNADAANAVSLLPKVVTSNYVVLDTPPPQLDARAPSRAPPPYISRRRQTIKGRQAGNR